MNIGRSTDLILLFDLLLATAAWFSALWLHKDLHVSNWTTLLWGTLFGALQAVTFLHFGTHRSVWRFLSALDLSRLAQAVLLTVVILLIVSAAFPTLPPTVPLLYGALALGLLVLPRLLMVQRYESPKAQPKRALIVGAGRAATGLIQELLREKNPSYLPVALVDDDPKKWGGEIEGIKVVGGCDQLSRWTQQLHVDVVLLAIPSATEKEMRRLVSLCEACGLPFLTLPSRGEQGHGVQNLRHVAIEDLLERSPIQLDWSRISRELCGKRVLVTGGGGSIGSELCRQLADLPIRELIVLDHCEYNLYRLERWLREAAPHLKVVLKLGSVTDSATLDHLFETDSPEIVFHAAAYKQVPLLEFQLREAVVNNVLGTYRLARAAVEYGVDRFVLISTDKAVNPSCVMGATKRASEMICQGLNGLGRTRFITVRFGNVLDSVGSVVPLFREQIAQGGPVTVTHPEVSRYFMTKKEACHLILKATAVGQGGEIFVLDMGEPIKILELAEQMIRLSGKVPHRDIEIRYIGLRPGEKLHEELFHPQEPLLSTPYDKLLLARSRPCDLRVIEHLLRQIEIACERYNESQILRLLKGLVPEFALEAQEHDDGHHRTPRLHRPE